MAKVDVRYNCGCGNSYIDPVEAAKHCDDTGHKLTVSGSITPDAPRVRTKKRVSSAPARVVKVVREAKRADAVSGYDNLRKRLGG